MTKSPTNESHPASEYDADYYSARYQYSPRSMYWWSVRYYARVLLRNAPEHLRRQRVLEVGCGVGHLLHHLAGEYEVWGLDTSHEGLRQTHVVEPKAHLCQGDLQALPFGDAEFDMVVARHVLEHLARPELGVAELRRIVHNNGLLLAAMPNPMGLGHHLKGNDWIGFQDPTHVSLLTPTDWRDLFSGSGFSVLREWGDGLWDVPYVPVIPAIVQLACLGLPAAIQVLSGRELIPSSLAESVIFLLRADEERV